MAATTLYHHDNHYHNDRIIMMITIMDEKNQVGYGYHKETKCSSHPKKSCHDVAKHVSTMLKTLYMIIMSCEEFQIFPVQANEPLDSLTSSQN